MTSRIAWLPFLAACALSGPFEGPGYDAQSDTLLAQVEGDLFAVATHTRVASGAGSLFNGHVEAVEAQLQDQPGFVGHALRGELGGRERWTLTVWEDEDSVVAFATEGAHLDAMADTSRAIDGIYSVAWALPASELPPSWSDALDRLAEVEPADPWN